MNKELTIIDKEKKKIKCPRCGNTELYLCSMGAWNCPDCFNFVRMATKEERNKQLKAFEKLEILNKTLK